MTEVEMTIPFTPPSVNHYKKPRAGGRGFYVTKEGLAFKSAVCLLAKGRTLSPISKSDRTKVRYGIWVKVFLGKGERGDGDNFWKCIADGLVDADVIHSDARVKLWHLEVEDEDRENPRTEISVEIIN